MMLELTKLRNAQPSVLFLGSHKPIIQSMLDFDYLSGKKETSVKAIIASGRRYERFFFGSKEVLIPVFSSVTSLPDSLRNDISYFYNATSGRRTLSSSLEALTELPHLAGGALFAEDVPEQHALTLYEQVRKQKKFLIGPASVGLLLPGILKLGAIGGVDVRQLTASSVMTPGEVAVFSASGGMTNEIIRIVAQKKRRLSFALSFGGDRFPVFTPKEAFLAAEEDPQTKAIIYFGELGGTDEYELMTLLKEKKVTKPVICYIGGVVADLFETPPQFGHAKAMAKTGEETARVKRDGLREAGAHVAESFSEFVESIGSIPPAFAGEEHDYSEKLEQIKVRKKSLITTSISHDQNGDVQLLGEDLLTFAGNRSFAGIVSSLFLGREQVSPELEAFVDSVLKLLVEHGPNVSGAVNTIVTARAGRDLPSALATGLLTIGPRFGGAINQAAANWLRGVSSGVSAHEFVEEFARRREYISGIGHRKYRSDTPDPRVAELKRAAEGLSAKRFLTYALEVEKVTVAKKGNLILNVDGTIAAILLDILSEKEGMSDEELGQLVETEFFNALFVLSRSVGFIAHFLDQKRLDEGLLRLDDSLILSTRKK